MWLPRQLRDKARREAAAKDLADSEDWDHWNTASAGELATAIQGSFSQGTPEPPELLRHTYGKSATIHQTGTIDIQVHEGKVVGVWFRCLSLPFQVAEVQDKEVFNPCDSVAIEEITYVVKEVHSDS